MKEDLTLEEQFSRVCYLLYAKTCAISALEHRQTSVVQYCNFMIKDLNFRKVTGRDEFIKILQTVIEKATKN